MRLLIIEDDKNLALVMREGLEKRGFCVDIAASGLDGEEKADVNDYDVILLDLNLPDRDGLEVLAAVRGTGNETPIIVITARGDVSQRAFGLNQGADDYITKPFDFVELEARIHAVVRRLYGRVINEIEIGTIKINPSTRKVFVCGLEMLLSAKEFDILLYIASRHPEVVSSEDIVGHVYDEFFDPFSSVLRVHIANLRKKLTAVSGDPLLQTIKGKGYQLCEKE